jgi:predicted RNA binding protein YcfA (HicA-like mRNA interferase family)
LPKPPVLCKKEVEDLLMKNGFAWIHTNTKKIHRICQKDAVRVVLPFHAGKSRHSKIVEEVLLAIGEL